MENKKVFSVKKFILWSIKADILESAIISLKSGWPFELEGKTADEINAMGYEWNEEWMEVIESL